MKSLKKQKGFTLIELMIVIAINCFCIAIRGDRHYEKIIRAFLCPGLFCLCDG